MNSKRLSTDAEQKNGDATNSLLIYKPVLILEIKFLLVIHVQGNYDMAVHARLLQYVSAIHLSLQQGEKFPTSKFVTVT